MAKLTLDIEANFQDLTVGLNSAMSELTGVTDQSKKAKSEMNNVFSTGAKSAKDFSGEVVEVISLVGKTGKELAEAQKKVMALFNPKEVKEYNKEVGKLGTGLKEALGKSEEKGKSLKAQLRGIKEELTRMEESGQDNTEAFFKMTLQAAKLEDAIGDTQQRVKALASDTAKLDAFVEVGQGMAAGFAIAQGAAALLGEEDEDLQRTIVKLSAAQNILNGVQQLGQLITGQGAAKTFIAAGAQKVYTFAVGASTGALKVFRIALLATGIGAIVFLLYEAAKAMNFFGDEAEDTTEKIKAQADALEQVDEEINESKIARIKDARKRELAEIDAAQKDKSKKLAEQVESGLISEEKYQEGLAESRALWRERTKSANDKFDKEAAEKRDSERKKRQSESKEEEEKKKRDEEELLKNQMSFEEKLKALKDQFADARAMTDEEKILREKEIAEESIDLLEKQLKDAGKILDKNFALTKDQEDQLKFLREKVASESNKKLRDLQIAHSDKELQAQKDIALAKLDQMEAGGLLEEDFTRLKEEKKLEIEIEFAQKRLALLSQNPELNKVAIEEIKGFIIGAQNELKELEKGDKGFSLAKLLGVSEDDLEKLKDAAGKALDEVSNLLNAVLDGQIDKNQDYIDSLDERIAATQEAIDQESEAQREGQANNLALEQQNLATLMSEKQKAIEEQKKLQKQQLDLQAAEQVSALITSSANIFKSLSPLGPLGIGLAVITIGSMLASFAVAQKKARESIDAGQKLRKGGPIEFGRSHEQGGHRIEGTDIEVEGDEFVVNRFSSRKHRKLVEALNADNFKMLTISDILPLLEGTGVGLSDDLPDRITKQRAQLHLAEITVSSRNETLEKETRSLRQDFNSFRKEQKDKEHVTETATHRIIKKGNQVRRVKKA